MHERVRRLMKDNRTYYNEFSGWYEKRRGRGYHALIDDLQFGILEEEVTNREVLEIGCGTGLIQERVAKVAKRAVGVDISPGMLELARERGLEVVEGEATALPFESESFDVVYSFKVLAHVKEIDTALTEAVRVVRAGGIVVLDFYNRRSLRYLAKRVGGPQKISEETHEDALYTRWDTPEEVLSRLPENVTCVGMYGVRIVTPFAQVLDVPILGGGMEKLEWGLHSRNPFARFGGFLVIKARKKGR